MALESARKSTHEPHARGVRTAHRRLLLDSKEHAPQLYRTSEHRACSAFNRESFIRVLVHVRAGRRSDLRRRLLLQSCSLAIAGVLSYFALRYAIRAKLTRSDACATAPHFARVDLSNPITAIIAAALSWSGLTIWTLNRDCNHPAGDAEEATRITEAETEQKIEGCGSVRLGPFNRLKPR